MSTRLRELLAGIVEIADVHDRDIVDVVDDSRHVCAGALFLALPGETSDGRDYINEAVARGAAAVLAEAGAALPEVSVPLYAASGLARRAGLIAARFFSEPSTRLRVVGVTGTNGKTTCTQLIAQALEAVEPRCGVIGTLGVGFPDALVASVNTTPGPVQLQRAFAQFVRTGARYVAMEVSSHALAQDRVEGTAFELAVFTNLTRDHLDYHGDMAAYGAAKARLFAWPGLRCAVINIDDAYGRELLSRLPADVRALSYGFNAADVCASDWRTLPDGIEILLSTPVGDARVRAPLLGRFNVANLLAVAATLIALGVPLDVVVRELAAVRPVAGRLERFVRQGAPLVVVDYAHTPDALENVLQALRAHARGKLWCVFGCGGDRDRGKRPLMGALAERYADCVIVTDDNPRTEAPEQIIADIAGGMARRPRVLRDRAAAITAAVREAAPEDIVLVAGKGHEDYQQIGNRRLPFSDREVVQAALEVAA